MLSLLCMDDIQNPPTTQPVSSPQKEVGPAGAEAYLEPVSEKPEVSKELKEAGLEPVTSEIEVPYEAKKAGLEMAKEAVPVSVPTAPSSTVPFTMAQSLNILKIHKKISDAIVWLAMWCIRQLKRQR